MASMIKSFIEENPFNHTFYHERDFDHEYYLWVQSEQYQKEILDNQYNDIIKCNSVADNSFLGCNSNCPKCKTIMFNQ